MRINKGVKMNKENINNARKRRSKWAFLLKGIIGIVVIVAVFLFLITLFSTGQRIHSLNAFLSAGYVYFLLLRIVIYGIVIYMCLKMKPKIKPTRYYRTFIRTCYACMVFVLFNEVMLYIRLMGK